MIVEKTGELLALIQAQMVLQSSLLKRETVLAIIPPVLTGLLLLLLLDYGRMIYLHFKMARTYLIIQYMKSIIVFLVVLIRR